MGKKYRCTVRNYTNGHFYAVGDKANEEDLYLVKGKRAAINSYFEIATDSADFIKPSIEDVKDKKKKEPVEKE
jgi:hypothetical protein